MNEYELKIKALLEGLETQNIEKFMREAKVVDYRNYGKAYVSAARNKIKEEKPLFITEDGVELFSDIVTLYAVDLNNQGIESPEWDFKECEKMGLKIFYYKKNADEYIEENKPKPLFVTEDGVEVFLNNVKLFAVNEIFETASANNFDFDFCKKEGWKLFFHKSNADEYIWRNKRVFSYEDMMKAKHSIILTYEDIEKAAKERS